MDREERKELIQEYLAIVHVAGSAIERIAQAFGPHPEGPVQDSINILLVHSTLLLKKLTNDTGDWIEWFFFDNNMGKNEFVAGYDDNTKPIKTVDDLVDLMEEADKR